MGIAKQEKWNSQNESGFPGQKTVQENPREHKRYHIKKTCLREAKCQLFASITRFIPGHYDDHLGLNFSQLKWVVQLQVCDLLSRRLGSPQANALSFLTGLKKNKSLEVLRIGKNPYLSPGAYSFLKAIRRNQESALQELHLDNMALDGDCHRELEDVLKKRPDFKATWQVSIQGGQAREIQYPERPSPLDIFVKFGRSSGLRMVDLFKILSGKRDTIGENAFISGLKNMNITMTKHELKKLFSILDVNGDGKLQFHEFPNLVALKLHEENAERLGNCRAHK